jgi:hypothetical protein
MSVISDWMNCHWDGTQPAEDQKKENRFLILTRMHYVVLNFT